MKSHMCRSTCRTELRQPPGPFRFRDRLQIDGSHRCNPWQKSRWRRECRLQH
eukprot:21782_5